MPLLRPQSSERNPQRLARSGRRSFCRHGRCTFTEVARLVHSGSRRTWGSWFIGGHSLFKATCLIRPHLLDAFLVVSRIGVILLHYSSLLKNTCIRQAEFGGKFTTPREIGPVCRSFCRHGSCTFTELARFIWGLYYDFTNYDFRNTTDFLKHISPEG